MLKACRDCKLLRTVSYSGNRGTVECSGHPIQHVEDPHAHVEHFVCGNFEPGWPSAESCEILRRVCNARLGSLTSALDRWFAGPPNDVVVHTRGAWLSVSEGGLESFEGEKEFKSYKGSNHMFADLLGGTNMRTPFVVYLSRGNAPGADVAFAPKSKIPIVSLGQPYSLAEVTAAISYVLSEQRVTVVSPWFRRRLKESGIDPDDPSFGSIVPLPLDFAQWLKRDRSQLPARAVVFEDGHIDLDAIADEIQIAPETRAIISCGSSDRFHCSSSGRFERDVAPLSEISTYFHTRRIRAVFIHISARDKQYWSKLPKNAFDDLETVFALAEPKAVSWIMELHAFADFECLRTREERKH